MGKSQFESLNNVNHVKGSPHLSMHVVFMVSSLMYSISVAWASWQETVKVKCQREDSQYHI